MRHIMNEPRHNAALSLRNQVMKFHEVLDQPIVGTPKVPDDKRVRLRASLITEEYIEVMRSLFGANATLPNVERIMEIVILRAPVDVDLPELADGLADLDYVVEGTRLEFGIDGEEVAAEVHRANMTKASGPVSPEGKRLKPEGFKPPDIEGVLRKQGWQP